MGSTTVPPSLASSPGDPVGVGGHRHGLLADLASPERRRDAARTLAHTFGADDLILFTPDPEVGVLLPAPGFPQTLPGGARWQALLRGAVELGRASGAVTPPGATAPVASLAVAGRDGSAAVLIGATAENGEVDWLRALLPLLAGAFRGEREAITAAGQASVARSAAAQAEALALSLDKVRRELGEALVRVQATADENARLLAEAREADRRKSEFLATLAHELRNPLAPVRTGLQVLKLTRDPEAAVRAREMMDRQLAHMVRLVDDLLDVARITRGKIELRRDRVDFKDVVTSAVETSLPLIEAGRHELSVELPGGPLPLSADLTRLAQVFSNLLTNAAKYTPEGGRIVLAARCEGTQVVVRVTDTGVGIPRENLPEVFEMFTQVGRNLDRAQGGLGIGLTLVRRLTEMHGGTVEADSPGAGKGSTFTVRLPLAAGVSSSTRDNQPEAPGGAARGRRLRILVVDDNVDGAESLAMLVTLYGHDARTAHGGEEGLSAVLEFRPDVVFLDIGLPGLNGLEVARRVRRELPESGVVLVALTGWGGDEDRRQSKDAGFDHHLTKPVEAEAIEALLASVSP